MGDHRQDARTISMIVWKSSTVSPRLASFRYRVALPALYLRQLGIRSRIGWHPLLMSLRGADVVIFSKTFHPRDLALARRAHGRGIPIVFDLCDNIFVEGYPAHARIMFGQIAELASLVTVSTASLAEVVVRHGIRHLGVVVIPDPAERPHDTRAVLRGFLVRAGFEWVLRNGFAAGVKMRRVIGRTLRGTDSQALRASASALLAKKTPKQPEQAPTSSAARYGSSPADGRSRKRIVTWFGNHGGDYSDFGMLDILIAGPALERLARYLPIKLRVISNNAAKFREHIAPLRLETEYCEWSPRRAHRLVRASDVVIVPSTLNDFTRCKSPNRLLYALDRGVPVVTTRTPASIDLEGCVLFEDWETNIHRYLTDGTLRNAHLIKAQSIIGTRYNPSAVASQWKEAIEVATRAPRIAPKPVEGASRIVLLVNLVQDLELIIPIYRESVRRAGWRTDVWVTTQDLIGHPEICKRLSAENIPYQVVDVRYADRGGFPGWSGVAALLSASESTAAPHWHAHQIAKLVKRFGVRTYTLQHGFQNVGLTYGDERFPVRRIRFESDVIFLWGTLESLHPDVVRETRAKCVPVGCPKPVGQPEHELPLTTTEPLVAIFENLHATRYDDKYRESFLGILIHAAKQRPDLRFLVKPHPAGRYLAVGRRSTLAMPQNVVIADPQAKDWLDVSTADILAKATAAITSVTTVAFDAARAGKRVAISVAAYRGDLTAFRPLTFLQTPQDWVQFLHYSVDVSDPGLDELSRRFSSVSSIPGDAVGRILDAIAGDIAVGRRATA